MARTADQILRDIEAFAPVDGVWLPLDQLLTELFAAGVSAAALSVLFGVFERFPEEDGAGVLWSIVHGVEHLVPDYERALRESMARRPSLMGRVMLERLERSSSSPARDAERER